MITSNIIINLGQILLSFIAHTHSHTHVQELTHAHRRRRSGCRCSMGRWRPAVTELRPFSPVPLGIMAGRCFIQINSRAGDSEFAIVLGVFRVYKIYRSNWDANSWQDVLSVDTNNLRHLPRRSSKNCDLQFANWTDRHAAVQGLILEGLLLLLFLLSTYYFQFQHIAACCACNL